MALYSELPVYKVTYQLLMAVITCSVHVSREHRYSLCQDLRNRLMGILLRIYRANRIPEKAPIIHEAMELLVEARIYMRLLADLHQISVKQYAQLCDLSELASKQLSAWERYAS